MGLCPSRNIKASPKHLQTDAKTYTPLPQPLPSLRADAAAFVPKAEKEEPKKEEPKEKEPWEQFLDQKSKEAAHKGPAFARKTDGTYTADYRRLLGAPEKAKYAPEKAKYVPPQQRCDDWIQEWKDTKTARPLRPAPGLTKPKAKRPPVGPLDADAKLKAALQKVKQTSLSKEAALAKLDGLQAAYPKDDAAAPGPLVPFGLTDAHYLSDSNDAAGSARHCATVRAKPRAYAAAKPITPELELRMAAVLHSLRLLKSAEQAAELEQAGRRYCVGIREVARTLKDKQNCPLKAVLVAPDVEADCTTARGNLDERLRDLIAAANALGIPVIYGLSRVRLGQAIKKSVTISVLGILSVRGMQEPFDQMLRAAA